MTITFASAHGRENGNSVYLGNNSLTFTCELDGNTTTHTYPRATDPIARGNSQTGYPRNLYVSNVTTNTFDIQVLDFPPSSNTSNHTFVSAINGAFYRKKDAAIYDTAVNIESVTATTITVQTLENAPSTNTTPHTFVSAIADAVVSGGGYTHEFVQTMFSNIYIYTEETAIEFFNKN